MFCELPPWYHERVRDFLAFALSRTDDLAEFRRLAPFLAGLSLLTETLGKDPHAVRSDPWLGLAAENGIVPHAGTERVTQLGGMLFSLLREPGLSEIIRRLSTRAMRATAFELFAAHHLHSMGFEIRARPEVGQKGQDFDFSAHMDGELINVEVKEFVGEIYREGTLRNAFKKKAKSVPVTDPAALFLFYPKRWADQDPSVMQKISTEAERFLAHSQRYNLVVAAEDSLGPTPYAGQTVRLIFNQNPRHECFALRVGLVNMRYRGGYPRQDMYGIHSYSDDSARFFRWVRWVSPC